MNSDLDIAVIIPCYNEAQAISSVVKSFKKKLPEAQIYVYDNNSTDDTAEIAMESGAIVREEPQQGKGHVVRRMFSDIEASIYVLVDGDGTYDAASARAMVDLLLDSRCDMVNARRITGSEKAYRFGHQFGNRLFNSMVGWIFGKRSTDMLSGYRVFSRRFVKSFPALSTGFEIETELTVHALSLSMPITELPTPYHDRPLDSVSKLNTYRDGLRILLKILLLTKEERPLLFFSVLSAQFAGLSLGLGLPVVYEWLQTGLVLRIPTAIAAASIMLLAFLCVTTGLILDSVARGRKESKRLHYLNMSWLGEGCRGPRPGA